MNSALRDYATLTAGAALAALCVWYWTRPSIPLPPGPKGHWILGSILEASWCLRNSNAFWEGFKKYTDEYGPIITVRLLFKKIIIISDPKIAAELMEKRGRQYSDRHPSHLATLSGWGQDIMFLEYGPTLRRQRALFQRALNGRVVQDYLPIQEHEIKRLMRRLLETPEKFMEHIHLMGSGVAIRLAYGYKVNSYDDLFLRAAENLMNILTDTMIPGRWMVELFPFLQYLPTWFPGATFHKAVASWKQVIHTTHVETVEYAKRQLAAGMAEPSFVSKLLEPEDGKEVSAEEEMDIKSVAFAIFAGGSDTTIAAVQSFFLAMTLHPEIQAKAQAEIKAYIEKQSSSVGGQNRSDPRFITVADRPNLPYTDALVRELFRWHPVVPLGVRKTCGKDDDNVVVNGKTYRIPAHTSFVVNVWNMLHDPDVYADPERFMPERFLADNPPQDLETHAFGFGRRNCPGMYIAQQSLWLSASNILANFMIERAKDENGVEIVPEERFTNNVTSHPVPFKCKIQAHEGCEEWLSEIED